MKAIIYARVSTDEQAKGYSLQTQIAECEKYALEKGYVVVGVFADDYTGASIDRPELNKLRAFVAKNEVDRVVVLDLDRLARKVVFQMLIEEELSKQGITIDYVIGQYADSDEGRLQKQIRASIAEYEKSKILERMKRGKRGKTQAGFVMCGSRPPYGYTINSEPHKSWLVIDEDEAKVVKMVFDLYLTGNGTGRPLSMNKIAKHLTELGILTRGDKMAHVAKKRKQGVWQPAMIRHILENETYTGIWHFGKTQMIDDGKHRKPKNKTGTGKQVKRAREDWIPVEVPAIINKETYDKAQARRKFNNEMADRHVKYQYLLGRRLECGVCGYSMVGRTRVSSNGNVNQYYYDKGKEQVPMAVCDLPTFQAKATEETVWEWVKSLVENPSMTIEGLRQTQEKIRRKNQVFFDRLAMIDGKITDNERQLSKLLDLYLDEEFPKEMLTERKARLEENLLKLKKTRAEVASHLELVDFTDEQRLDIENFCDEIRPRLANATFDQKRRLFDMLNLRGKLFVENGQKIIEVTCRLGQSRRSVLQTSHS